MDKSSERLSRTIWIGVALVIVLTAVAFVLSGLEKQAKAQPELPVIGPVADFSLTNELGEHVDLGNLRGRVWVADIIFTRCPGPCTRMSHQMKSIQDALPPASQARLVSLTTDADYDTPPILKEYAARYAADTNRWMFLTGGKTNIANLAIDSLKLTALAKPAAERTSINDLFVHSTIFVVIDKQAQLRGVFETGGDGVEWTNVQPALLATVAQLEREK